MKTLSKSRKSAKPARRPQMSASEKLDFISRRLRRGDYRQIAESTGYHVSHVARVIKGENGNPSGEIVNAAYRRVNKRKPTMA